MGTQKSNSDLDLGCRVLGLGFWVLGYELRVWGLGFGFRVMGLGCLGL